jgi:hypothetical protein
MPILAVCPYCHEGTVRAPDHALGLSVACPRCHNCFTLVDSKQLPKAAEREPAAPAAAAKSAPVAALQATVVANERITPQAMTSAADTVKMVPAPPLASPEPAPSNTVALPRELDLTLPLALVAVLFGGTSLLISQLPYGRVATLAVAGLGLLMGLGSLLVAEQKRLVPLLAAGLNAVALLLVIALPSWLGLTTWWPTAPPDDSKTVKAVGYDGSVPAPAEWVDISTAAWQRDDVRVAVSALTIGPVELTGPNGKKRATKEKYLQIWLQVSNSGVARKFDFRGWDATAPQGAPRLTDSAGKVLAAKTFEPGWEPPGRPQTKALFPGKTADNLLIFEPPAHTVAHLRLELPGDAFSGTEAVRFLIPRSSIGDRAAP